MKMYGVRFKGGYFSHKFFSDYRKNGFINGIEQKQEGKPGGNLAVELLNSLRMVQSPLCGKLYKKVAGKKGTEKG
jgi:hypothetical protein